MNIFTAPNWDIDEASAAISSNAFGGTIPSKSKSKKLKMAGKNLKLESSTHSTGIDGIDHRFVRAKQLRRLKMLSGKAKEMCNDTEGNSITSQSKAMNNSAGYSGVKIAKKIDGTFVKEKSIMRLLRAKEKRKAKPENSIDMTEKTDSSQTLNKSPTKLDGTLTKNQKRSEKRKQIRMKKKIQSNSQEVFIKTPAQPKKVDGKKGESNDKAQSKLGKLLDFQKKKKKAGKTKECITHNSTSLTTHTGNDETPKQKVLKLKLKKKEKKLQKKREAIFKKMEQAQELLSSQSTGNQNEVVLSNSRKKKMRKTAKQLSQGNLNKGANRQELGHGTTNPSFNESLSESSAHNMSHNDSETNAKKKRKGKKKRYNQLDSVDGNLISISNASSLESGCSSLKKHYLPVVTDSNTIVEKSKKKKIVVAKLLQEANIVEKSTLHDLKKKRRSSDYLSLGSSKKKNHGPASLGAKMAEQLKSARFRWLNEQLYTSDSWEAHKYFKEDPEAYEAYHSGYRNQVAQWPLNPVDVIMKSISSMPKGTVVADFGCGDARLAETLSHFMVHSFDLVAKKPGVTACDMAHTPLLMESVDVAVFCLSLMGKNLNDFILEANRVLKIGGLLLIAEVESRLDDVDNFTSAMVHFGFHLKKKDVSNQMFIFMDFKKARKVSKTGKLPALALDPCVYKKR